MSDSKKQREVKTRDGTNGINSKAAKKHDTNVKKVCAKIFKEIQKEYPQYNFSHAASISKEEIAKAALGKDWRSYKPSSTRSTGPKPDGGIIYVHDGDKKYPVLIAEAKKQGTNDVRMAEGLKKQARGNAIERAYKNVEETKIFTQDLDYFPYTIVAHGYDFKKGSSILDRLDGLTKYRPRNKDYTLDKDQKTTVHVRAKEFSKKEIYDRLKPSTKKCVDHVISAWMIADYKVKKKK
jgi:hypothetical protein